MKNLILVIVLILGLVGLVRITEAQEAWTAPLLLCNAETTDAALCETTAADTGLLASKGTCVLTASGTAATTFVVSLYGSIDNITFAPLSIDSTAATYTFTIASANNTFSFINQPVRYLNGYRVSKTGGDATSAITMKCAVGGN